MFHGPVVEVWQGLHMQINLSAAAKRQHRRREVKALWVPPKECHVKQCAQGLWRGTCWALQCHSSNKEREGHGGSATSCTLVQSAGLQARHERCQQPRGEAHGSWVPSQAGFGHKSQDPVELLEGERGRRKRGIIPPPLCCAGPQLSAGCQPKKWHSCRPGALAMAQQCCMFSPACPPHPPLEKPGSARDRNKWEKRMTKMPTPSVKMPIPSCAQDFAGDSHPSQLCRTRQPAQPLPWHSTETRD